MTFVAQDPRVRSEVEVGCPHETAPAVLRESPPGVFRKGFSSDEEDKAHDGPDHREAASRGRGSREALNHFVVLGLAHFDHIVREFVDNYHGCRPYQGIGTRLIRAAEDDEETSPITNVAQVHREARLGGLLKSYRRAA